MTLLILAYLGGVLTIVSPCILPVLPFVFARADQPFLKNGLPLLLGMAVTFALVATLATVGGGWIVAANQYGRYAALILMGLFGVTLLFPSLAERLTAPLVALGSRLSEKTSASKTTFVPSLVLGVATGLLWAPCAGPILGLVLTGAALQGASTHTSLLLLSYAAGAATSLALALVVGGRVFKAMKRSLGAGEWIRRGIGALLLVGVAAIALGLDTGFLSQLSLSSTSGLEQALVDKVRPPSKRAPSAAPVDNRPLPIEGPFPPLAGATEWINSPPLSVQDLKGKVVLVDFWTYSCINCLRSIPYVRAWAQKYRDQGLVVIGVHAPEFAFEKNISNVRKAVKDLGIDYPVAVDNDYAIWGAFDNEYWPAHYFIDAQGQVRYHKFGEGDDERSERVIQQLLREAGHTALSSDLATIDAKGAQAESDKGDVKSPETYVGYARAEHFAAPGGAVQDKAHRYPAVDRLALNEWTLVGDWTVHGENGVADAAGSKVVFRFHARDLHLVLGPREDGKPARFRVTIDGKPPGASHGMDIDENGNGTVTEERLYQLVRQPSPIADHTFEIEFLDPGARAFAFTFG